MRPYKETKHFHGFTLIELLVVVAIIAVLIAILLPSIQSARDQAKTIACLANHHQLAIATQAYMGDNKDWLPMPIYLFPPNKEINWNHTCSLFPNE